VRLCSFEKASGMVVANGKTSQRIAALGDLRTFIELSRERGELEVIRGADPHLEMGALYELSLRELYPPVLLFEEIKGYPAHHKVVMNVRFSRMFVGDLSLEAVKERRANRAAESEPIAPEYVESGPILSNVLRGADVNVLGFPSAKWHDGDGGRYIGTECLIITKDPDSDWVNVGTYRVQVHDAKTVTIFIEPGKHGRIIRQKYWDRGLPCPTVVVVGQAPVLGNVAGMASGYGESELAKAGGIIGRPIRVVRGELTGLPIPADAELAFEGFSPPIEQESRVEGPFAEWTGYYASDSRPEPVLHVEAIYHRDDPIVIGQPPAKPTFPGRQTSLGRIVALWDALEAAGVPGVTGVWKPVGGGERFVSIIAIKQMFDGHAKMAGLVATGAGPSAFLGRITIVVDDDIDITDPAEVMWALATRWDPKTQTDIIDGNWTGNLDPTLSPEKRAARDFTSSRAIIYAVRPYRWKDQFPKVNVVSREYSAEVEKKWAGTLSFLKAASGRQ
jgi:UbiD family decarboxylase